MLLLLRLEKFASLRWREFFWKIKKWSRIFDINLRQSYYNEELIRSSLEVCEILKINDEELEVLSKMFGIPGTRETIVKTLAENTPVLTIFKMA